MVNDGVAAGSAVSGAQTLEPGAAGIDRKFWENELELSVEQPLTEAQDRQQVSKWITGLSPRQRTVLCRHLGIDAEKAREQRSALRGCNGQLVPFYLVDRFAWRKNKFAVADLAQRALDEALLEACRSKDDRFDSKALLYALFAAGPDHLRMLFHLDKIHKSGFARMALVNPPRRPERTFEDFLTAEQAQAVLAQCDARRRDRRVSELKSVVRHNHHHLVFIRRPERPEHIMREGSIAHGYRAEWIILDFAENARRVNLSSMSPDVPVEIANALASAYYGQEVEYDNERLITYAPRLVQFLDELKEGRCQGLSLLGLGLRNSPLSGADLGLSHEDEAVVRRAIAAIERDHGSLTDDLDRIEGLKVEYYEKRIEIRFEKQGTPDDAYIVRYFDSRLHAVARKRFEDFMRDTHDIPILSTEKRFKHRN